MIARFTPIALFSTISLYLLLASGPAAETVYAQGKRESPLTLGQILTGLQTQGKTSETRTLKARNNFIIQRVRERGVDFELDEGGEEDLRDAGATADLIFAIRDISFKKETQGTGEEKTARETVGANDFFDRGQQCAQNDFDCRVSNFSRAIESDPGLAKAYLYRGLAKAKKNRFDEAIADYTKAIELNPGNSHAHNNRGVAYAKKGDFGQAILDYTRALELNPRDGNTYHNRGNAYAKLNDFQPAISDYDKALEFNPSAGAAGPVYKNRGHAHFNLKNYELAIGDYNKAIEFEPQNADLHRLRADAYYTKGDFHQAIVDYTRTIELNPSDPHAYEFRGYSYQQLGVKSKGTADGRMAEALKNKR